MVLLCLSKLKREKTPPTKTFYNVQKIKDEKINIPILIGGATTSKTHTAVKIVPHTNNPIIHVSDASLAVNVCQKVLDPKKRDSYIKEIKESQERLKDNFLRRKELISLLPLKEAQSNRFKIDWNNFEEPTPQLIGNHLYDKIELSEILSQNTLD